MIVADTTSTITAALPPQDLMDSSDPAMRPFTSRQCLFCPSSSPSFDESVVHMQKSHGLFVPHRQHLAVDLETLFRYLHLVIFGYRECIHCGTERATVQAVQQHMTGKGHCRFDISGQGSEFAEFYDFFDAEDNVESDTEDGGDEREQENTKARSNQKLLLSDEDWIRLPSGKIISRQPTTQAGLSPTQHYRRTQFPASQLEYSIAEPIEDRSPSKEDVGSHIRDTRLSKRAKRERATATYQFAKLSSADRASLMHLPASQQRSILGMQHRHAEKTQKEETRQRGRIDRKGNKNLYAYWHTETPVYQCG